MPENFASESSQVMVAMSGGVDSSVAALLLKQQEVEAIGVSMQVWDYRKNGGCASKATCCSPDDFTDARSVSAKLGIPYYVFDMEDNFKSKVIDVFVKNYYAGKTPNPCVECNNHVKFKELRERANRLNISTVATGHYAQIKHDSEGYHLLRGKDADKDQSYFLYGLKQSELPFTKFPVGHLLKTEVRSIAAENGLVTASKPESQDICFVSGTVQDFLIKIGRVETKLGKILNSKGEVLGEHQGIHNFTVGQRRGLKIGGEEEPLYVLELRSEDNAVVVGTKNELETAKFIVNELNWIEPKILKNFKQLSNDSSIELECLAQLRHRHNGNKVKIKIYSNYAEVNFTDSWTTVSPGQAAVFYDLNNEEVLGGGKIFSSQRD